MIKFDYNYWGDSKKGESIMLFRLTNDSGAYVEFINLGASWISAVMPARDSTFADVLLGYKDLNAYIEDTCYMGCIVGRFANRIADARFSIGDTIYQLEANDGLNTNHGGFSGLGKKIWKWEEIPSGVRFSLLSPDGEGGYPGNIKLYVEYIFSDENTLQVNFQGTTDQETYLNLTNHPYFNLNGDSKPIYRHQLCIFSNEILETDANFIPTGKYVTVKNTPFDFTTLRAIGEFIHQDNQQLKWNKGYNHCYVLKKSKSDVEKTVAILSSPDSGRTLTIKTDLPGILFYTSGFLESIHPGKKGGKIKPDIGVCLEAQFFPDTPSHPHFPSCLLLPKEEYIHSIEYCFSYN